MNKGFTLIELIATLLLVAIMGVSLVISLLPMSEALTQVRANSSAAQKARLAMMGAEATVHQVMLQDKVWYRVRLGPFRKMDEVTGLRSELAK